MDKDIEYRGHKATLTIDRQDYHDFIFGFGHVTTIRLKSPQLRCISSELDPEDADLIKAIYTTWFEQIIEKKLLDSNPR